MKIYIASSWKHKHGVVMLTQLLRDKGHEVLSWIENSGMEPSDDFEKWVKSVKAGECFKFDTVSASNCDVLIYYGNAGKDAAAETGIAYANGCLILGLYSKGEDFGLMRRLINYWFNSVFDLINELDKIYTSNEIYSNKNTRAFNRSRI